MDKKSRRELTGALIRVALFFTLLYGLYWVFKTVSYGLFYEKMVIETIHEEVRPEYLLKIYQ